MKHYLTLILVITLSSCGKAPQKDTDTDVASTRTLFTQTTSKDISDVPVTFEELKLPTLALCIHDPKGPRIVVNNLKWGKMTKDVREHLMLHEFGHAIGLGHNNETDNSNKPISVMYPTIYVDNDEDYTNNKKYYLTQLQSISK